MASIDAWSFSRYNVYAQCPAKFKYQHIEKRDMGPPSAALKKGRAVHTSAERYVSKQRDDIMAELETRLDLLDAIRDYPSNMVMVEQKWGLTKNWKSTGWFNKKGRPNVWLRLTLDVGLDYGDGTFEVIDWKTGKKYGDNEEQMELFAVGVMARYPDVHHVTTRLSYVDLPAGPDSETFGEYTRDEYDALRTTWEERVEPMFNDTEFLPRPNRLCAYCPFSASEGGPCRHG
jgi:hypothetical protein